MSTKIRELLKSTSNNSDSYDERYMKIRFNSDDDLPINKTLRFYDKTILVRTIYHEGNIVNTFFR